MLKISAALAVLLLAGCHRDRVAEVQFTLTPTGDSVTAACNVSSSGDCYFAFTGTSVTIKEGDTVTVLHVPPGSPYCADSHAVHLDSCKSAILDPKRQTVTRRSSSDTPAG